MEDYLRRPEFPPRPRRILAGLLILFMTVTMAHGGPTNLPTIFVAPITASPGVRSWRASVGESLAEVLLNQLASSTNFGVLETSALEAIRTEIEMGKDGWMEPSQKTEQGHWLGADYMLAAKLTHFQPPSAGSGGGVIKGIPGLFAKKAKVQIVWRVVDTSARKVVASGTADSSRVREKFNFVKAAKGILGGGEEGGEALERALDLVLAQIVEDIEALHLGPTGRRALQAKPMETKGPEATRTTGLVEAVRPDFLIVGLGTRHGCKTGDKLELCEIIDIKNQEGVIIFKEPKVVGEIQMELCLEDRSKARYTTLVAPREGWLVRFKTPEPVTGPTFTGTSN